MKYILVIFLVTLCVACGDPVQSRADLQRQIALLEQCTIDDDHDLSNDTIWLIARRARIAHDSAPDAVLSEQLTTALRNCHERYARHYLAEARSGKSLLHQHAGYKGFGRHLIDSDVGLDETTFDLTEEDYYFINKWYPR